MAASSDEMNKDGANLRSACPLLVPCYHPYLWSSRDGIWRLDTGGLFVMATGTLFVAVCRRDFDPPGIASLLLEGRHIERESALNSLLLAPPNTLLHPTCSGRGVKHWMWMGVVTLERGVAARADWCRASSEGCVTVVHNLLHLPQPGTCRRGRRACRQKPDRPGP